MSFKVTDRLENVGQLGSRVCRKTRGTNASRDLEALPGDPLRV